MASPTLHPYPAMLPESLASRLVDAYVPRGGRLLDPFCGTARTLFAAAPRVAEGVGFDVNPLAILICQAKAAQIAWHRIDKLLNTIGDAANCDPGNIVDCDTAEVRWFSRRSVRELSALIECVNHQKLSEAEIAVVAAVLSATIREASYTRQSAWKLHRISSKDRSKHRVSPIQRFRDRLERLRAMHATKTLNAAGHVRTYLGDASRLLVELSARGIRPDFDAVVTSPPYGDSFTTVQYGGIARLVSPFLSELRSLDMDASVWRRVDGMCLGARRLTGSGISVDRYWSGSATNQWRSFVESYLHDLGVCLHQAALCVKQNGAMVIVVGNRRLGGFRQDTRTFCEDVVTEMGYELELAEERRIVMKSVPATIRANARSVRNKKRLASTIRREHILVFRRRWT